MVALPLSILALAAGIYLLVKVKREYLSGAFEILSWLVIVLSLVSIGFAGFRALHHCGGGHGAGHCGKGEDMRIEKRVIIKNDGMGHCHADSSMQISGCCKAEGDSMLLEKEACEMMMGAEACARLSKERGRCILSKEECRKACKAKGIACCAGKADAQCAPKCAGEKKSCCKH